jgi:hypothetical protein
LASSQDLNVQRNKNDGGDGDDHRGCDQGMKRAEGAGKGGLEEA